MLSAFNRLMVILLFSAVLASSVITMLVATEARDPDVVFGGWFKPQLQWIADSEGNAVTAIMAAGVVSALVSIIILVTELIPHHASAAILIKAASSEEGIATLDRDSVCKLAETAAIDTPSVRDVRCHARNGPEGLIISCDAWVELGANIPDLSTSLQHKIKASVENLTGFLVEKVNVSNKYGSRDHKRAALLE